MKKWVRPRSAPISRGLGRTSISKQHGNGVQSCESYDDVYDAAYERGLSTKQGCNKIVLKQSNQQPVQGPDDNDRQSGFIHTTPPFLGSMCSEGVGHAERRVGEMFERHDKMFGMDGLVSDAGLVDWFPVALYSFIWFNS